MNRKLELEKKRLEEMKETLQIRLSKLPDGRLRASSSHNTYQYYLGDRYISKKNIKLLEGLATREYYEKLIPYIDEMIKMYDAFLKEYAYRNIENVYNSLPEGKKILIKNGPTLLSKRIEMFENEVYKEGELPYEIVSEIYTVKGEHVRSKSEKIIADELYRLGIPYRYEKPYFLYDKGRKVILHPDFTVINKRTGKEYILEHLGLSDKQEYLDNAMDKLDLLERNGYLLGRDILLLHETQGKPLNVKVLGKYIDEYLI